eukprot:NODE_124_length_18806_cov_0.323996.p8 type:complete len:240 gc:universal NODE_124_length_18806_cov_0.323996:3069-2350(-)
MEQTCKDFAYSFPLLLNECVYTTNELFSFLLGYASIAFWICAQIPQILKNYKNKKYVNVNFIFIWLLGDICNLVGGKLTNQKPFQVYLAVYFVLIDTILLSQCIFYRSVAEVIIVSRRPSLSPSLLSPLILASPVMGGASNIDYQNLGSFISWICCLLYLCSRFPQLITNYKIKSVQSLSLTMFFCAIMGNTTYSLSLILHWSPNSFPFLLGSVGTIGLDLIVFFQYFMYKEHNYSHVD